MKEQTQSTKNFQLFWDNLPANFPDAEACLVAFRERYNNVLSKEALEDLAHLVAYASLMNAMLEQLELEANMLQRAELFGVH